MNSKSFLFDYGILIDASQTVDQTLSEILRKLGYGIDSKD